MAYVCVRTRTSHNFDPKMKMIYAMKNTFKFLHLIAAVGLCRGVDVKLFTMEFSCADGLLHFSLSN